MKLKILGLIFFASVTQAANLKTYACDVRDLVTQERIVGANYTVKLNLTNGTGKMTVVPFNTVVTTLKQVSANSDASTLFEGASGDNADKKDITFDLLPSGQSAILTFRNFSWEHPDILVFSYVFICSEQ